MKLIKATKEEDITLEGVSVTLQQVDGAIEAVVITDAQGKYIRVVKLDSYSNGLKVLIEEPVEFTTVYDVKIKKSDGGVLSYVFDNKSDLEAKIMCESEDCVDVQERLVEVKKDLTGKKVVDSMDIPF